MSGNLFRILCLLVCGVGLLFLQSFLLQYISKKGKVPHEEKRWDIKDVLDTARKTNFPLFVLDPNILQCFLERSTADDRPTCLELLPKQPIVQFGSLGQFASRLEEDFLAAFPAKGAKPVKLSVPNPKILAHGLQVLIPTHYFLSLKTQTIHIVVFHERPGNFWWHAAANMSADLPFDAKTDISYVKTDGAYDRVEILPISLNDIETFAPAPPETFLKDQPFIECNTTRARLFHTLHGRDESPEAELFRLKVRRLLVKVKQLLDQLDVPFWISSGTCLGFYRQCDVIPYTTDVDIGIFIKDYKPEIISVFSMYDLPLTHLFGKVEDSYELSFRDKDIKLDVFFFYEEDSYVWNGGTQARTGKKFKYIFPIFQLCWTEFLDLKLRIPCETNKYIEANYGQSWFQPLKQWDWKASPPNVAENGVWPVEEWSQVIQLFPLQDF
ncbi:ribitol-5-phosphate transferase FKTN-like isoform X2 [Ornithodoros turicata]|uniref:ribitol-5-phosphate transferase FKTN-like isoform X2 n=1 Tax=Ornithodoros turicata TaxID=34597 RepID=UPI003139BDC0